MMKKQFSGFTLVELMITIAIVGIMAAIAFPSMRDFVTSTRITNRAEQISNLMRFAKAEAMRRNVPVIICGTRIRSDGRPLNNNCSAADISNGLRAFADMDKNGTFDQDKDINLRTISINGNGAHQLTVTPKVFNISVNGTVTPAQDNINQFVFMPNGNLGRKTNANSFVGMQLAQNYVRFQISETGRSNTLSPAQRARTLIVAANPSGKVNICRDSNSADYEAAAVCSL